LLLHIVDELLAHGQVVKEKMAELLGVGMAREDQMLWPYAEQLHVFSLQHDVMQRMQGKTTASQAVLCG
jgi:cell division protease FtsH